MTCAERMCGSLSGVVVKVAKHLWPMSLDLAMPGEHSGAVNGGR